MTILKLGGLASFILAVAFIVPSLIYLVGDLRTANGPLTYDLADALYGPVWAACLVTVVMALRELMGALAPRRLTLALLAAMVAAVAMVSVACIRSANRDYHMMHPELYLDTSTPVLIVWTTLIAGLTATGWHFIGWLFVLVGAASWTTHRLPRGLSLLYFALGAASLVVYILPDMEGAAVLLGVVASIWQGILLWRAEPGERPTPELITSLTEQA